MRQRTSIYCCCLVTSFFLLSSVGFGAVSGPVRNPEASNTQSNPSQTTDTIRFKNGSILHGLVARFENGIFTVIIPGTQSRAMVHMNDVERIEFAEGSPSATTQATPVKLPPVQPEEEKMPPSPSRRPETAQLNQDQPVSSPPQMLEKPQTTNTTTTSKPPETKPAANENRSGANVPAAQPKAAARVPSIREVTVSVASREVWADSGLDVARGDKVRVSASGRVNLSRAQSAGPEGVSIADPGKMMPNRPTGGLIAVIGDDNDDFVFIGQTAEFTAPRSGRLFLMVNENNVEDNTGSFTVRLQVQSPPGP